MSLHTFRACGVLSSDIDTSIKGMVVIRLAGSLDAYSYQLVEELFEELFQNGYCQIAVDASGLDSVSSAGIGVLVGALARSRKQHGNLLLINASREVNDTLALLGLSKIFFHVRDRLTAIELLTR